MAQRELKDMPQEYLAERLTLLENYTAAMLTMLLRHHPYMVPAADNIGQGFAEQAAALEAKYPVSAILTPGSAIVKP